MLNFIFYSFFQRGFIDNLDWISPENFWAAMPGQGTGATENPAARQLPGRTPQIALASEQLAKPVHQFAPT